MWFPNTLLLVSIVQYVHSFSDAGKWYIKFSGENCDFSLAKSLFKNSEVLVSLHCDVVEATNITLTYFFSATPCSPDYYHYFEEKIVQCDPPANSNMVGQLINEEGNDNNKTLQISGRLTYTCESKKLIPVTSDRSNQLQTAKLLTTPLLTVEKTGVYSFYLQVQSNTQYNVSVLLAMKSPHGYLSAAIWPLLPFFGVMCAVYTVQSTCWLVVCALQWRDLLRIQYWIGGVALLGMVESATYYGVYSSINNSGYFNSEAYMFAEWVSVAKRALARMLVIIVSLGFGIVKPRLGPALQRIVGTGILWGVFSAIEAWMRLHHKVNDTNRDLLLSEAPLSLLDSAICWWVFVSLAYTMRTLQLRRNTVKLSLYRHFTNTLIFAVLSSVVFMLYSIKSYRFQDCITEWNEVWIDEAYWHILFASVLTVIMVLWRPTNNNQRYAFTPLLDNADDDDDEEEEQFVNDAYGVKMRNSSVHSLGGDNATADNSRELHEPNSNSLESDLRWVEENIPTSALPLLDSDEEIINTKFEVSKMQ